MVWHEYRKTIERRIKYVSVGAELDAYITMF